MSGNTQNSENTTVAVELKKYSILRMQANQATTEFANAVVNLYKADFFSDKMYKSVNYIISELAKEEGIRKMLPDQRIIYFIENRWNSTKIEVSVGDILKLANSSLELIKSYDLLAKSVDKDYTRKLVANAVVDWKKAEAELEADNPPSENSK